MKTVGLLALGGAMGLKFEDLSYNNLRDAFTKVQNFNFQKNHINIQIQAVPGVYGNRNLDTAIIGNDYLPYFKWCDANGDGSVALFESARCGSKSGFWYPAQVGWFDWATYATSISLEFSQIMMKYMDNIDRDHSMSLDQSEFAWHYAAMTHASAEAVFGLLDENKDGKLTGKFRIIHFRSQNISHIYYQRSNHSLQEMNTNYGPSSPNVVSMFLSQKLEIMLSSLPPLECLLLLLKNKSPHTFPS